MSARYTDEQRAQLHDGYLAADPPAPSPARGGPDSGHMCICTTPERQSGRYFRACPAHERPATSGVCRHTADEGCNGHGDF